MLRRFFSRLLILAFVLVLPAGCGQTGPASADRRAPGYARTAQHYRAFGDAEVLAAYLRPGSGAGLLLSAHRGGPDTAYPENALATFERALRYAPALIECDVRMTRDSVFVLMHDETLDRTTNGTGAVAGKTLAELRELLLKDPKGITTRHRIPTLAETLAWAEHRAVLTLDLKPGLPIDRLLELLHRYEAEDRVVLITYNLPDLLRLYRAAPGFNYSVNTASTADLQALLDSGVAPDRLIAFTGTGPVNPDLIEHLHRLNIRAMLGTFGLTDQRALSAGAEVYRMLVNQGIDVLATDQVSLAAELLK